MVANFFTSNFAKLFIEVKCTIAWQIHSSRLLQHLYFWKKHEKFSQMSSIMFQLNDKDINIINYMCSNVLLALPIFLDILRYIEISKAFVIIIIIIMVIFKCYFSGELIALS